MPLYHFECPVCMEKTRKILSLKVYRQRKVACKNCNCELSRVVEPPTSQVMETLDNGLMPKKLERLADSERLHHERAEQQKKKQNE